MVQYYVNPVSGKNTNSGIQESAPFKTITYALGQVRAGDRIQLAPGTYSAASGEKFPLIVLDGVTVIGNETKKGEGILIEGGGAHSSPSNARVNFNIAFLLEGNAQLRGVTVTNSSKRGSGVWIESPTAITPTVANCTLKNCDMEGVFVADGASPKILDSIFSENQGYGISLAANAKGEIRKNRLQKNGYGINTQERSAPLIVENTIRGNTNSGILISGNSQPVLRSNISEENRQDGITIITQAQPDLGTSQSPGGNLLRGNCQYDLQTSSTAALSVVGNKIKIDPACVKVKFTDKIKFQDNETPQFLPPPHSRFKVTGEVRQANGQPLVGATIKVFDLSRNYGIHKSEEKLLGETTTDYNGHYELLGCTYRQPDERPNLKVQTYWNEKLIAASPTIFQAEFGVVANLNAKEDVIPVASEYEKLIAQVTPVLKGVKPTDLNTDDLTFLAEDLGIERQQILGWSQAAQLSSQTQLPTEVFYGLTGQGLTITEPRQLLSYSLPTLKQSLEAALQNHLIPANPQSNLDQMVARLKAVMVEQAFQPAVPGKPSLGALLGTSSLNQEQQKKLVGLLVEYEEQTQDFWEKLGQEPGFQGETAVKEAKFTLQLGRLTQNHLPLVQFLQLLQQQGSLQKPQDLARFDAGDWLQLIQTPVNGTPIGFPPGQPGADDAAKALAYAQTLFRQVEAAFPTVSVAYQIEQGGGQTDLTQFFSNLTALNLNLDSDFDFATTRIDSFLSEHNGALTGITNPEGMKTELKTLQRLFKVSPHFQDIQVLKDAGFTSAQSIAGMGRETFAENYSASLGDRENALTIHTAATEKSALAYTVWSKYAGDFNKPSLAMLPKSPLYPVNLTNWTKLFGSSDSYPVNSTDWTILFGSPDLCACPHCRSVYSPAAYLVDLLQFLKKNSKVSNKTGLDVLLDPQRRPDIVQIQLSCENTNTPLPYVDLVIEILERAISSRQVDWPQTTWTAEELAANPENVNSDVYDSKLSQAVYPWNLPFDLSGAESRAYLAHLGTHRHELMEALSLTPDPLALLINKDIAGEYLELTQTEWNLLTQSSPPTWELWGLKQTNNNIPNPYAPEPFMGSWDTVLSHCCVLLERSGLKFEELTELLQLKFINPNGSIHLQPQGTCKLQEITLDFGGDLVVLRRICCFVRLQRKLGWTMQELDRALSLFLTQTSIDDDCLIAISLLPRLRQDVNLPLVPLLTWWGNIPTTDEGEDKPSLYRQLFLNKAVLRPDLISITTPDSSSSTADDYRVFEALMANPGGDGQSSIVKDKHLPRITAALEVTTDEILQILDFISSSDSRDLPLTLPNLSRLYRITSFCKLCKLSVSEFFALKQMSGIDPFAITTSLDSLPPNINLPKEIGIRYDSSKNKLEFEGAMTIAERARLLGLIMGLSSDSINSNYQTAINTLFDAKKELIVNTILFLRKIKKIRTSKFKIDELNCLLQHQSKSSEIAGTTLQKNTLILERIRVGLRKIADENQVVPDATGDVTRQKLKLLKWDEGVIEQAIAMFNNSSNYTAALDSLPQNIVLSGDIKIAYDSTAKILKFSGVMTTLEKGKLLELATGLPPNSDYQEAIEKLFDEPRTFVTQKMKAFEMPSFSVTLETLPPSVTFPSPIQEKISYDPIAKKLQFSGAMSQEEKEQLLQLCPQSEPSCSSYRSAIETLFNKSDTYSPEPTNQFLNEGDCNALFDSEKTVSDRFQYVLIRLLDYLCRKASESFVKQQLMQALKLEAAILDSLLTTWLHVNPTFSSLSLKSVAPRSPLSVFLDESFVQANSLIYEQFAEQEATAAVYPQFKTLTLLQKVAAILSKLRLNFNEVKYLFEHKSQGWLDLDSLPVEENQSSHLLPSWERLVDACQLRDRLGSAEPNLFDLFEMAATAKEGDTKTQNDFLDRLAKRMGWDVADFKSLREDFGINIPAYQDERPLLRLEACFKLSQRLGVKAGNLLEWMQKPRNIKQAVKAKYDANQWREIAKPLQDVLREQKRQSLTAYLTGKLNWTNDQLYGHYLIDVEMCACMMTSRIKQAISSVQLFVQRCLLGLEGDAEGNQVVLNSEAARIWTQWMKVYRVWEANRKIFLYPENWIEPELRDDKSPFFKDLEKELLQNEITPENVETAFLHYLEKLDAVSQLEIVAQYFDEERKLFYVFGRTPNTPHIYYYRYRNSHQVWSAWEKVDLDIEGDHLIPVVWNRRLHLFWPIFKEKTEKTAVPTKEQEVSEPKKYWQIQMAWSEYKQGKWTSKKVSPQVLKPKQPQLWEDKVPTLVNIPIQEGEEILEDIKETKQPISPIPFFGDSKNKGLFYFRALVNDSQLIIRILYSRNFLSRKYRTRFWPAGQFIFESNIGVPVEKGFRRKDHEFLPKTYDGFFDNMALYGSDLVVYFAAPTFLEMEAFFKDSFKDVNLVISTIFWQKSGDFRLLFPHQSQLVWCSSFFYQDTSRNLLVLPKIKGNILLSDGSLSKILSKMNWLEALIFIIAIAGDPVSALRYQVESFYHPYISHFIKELNQYGIEGLLNPKPGDPLYRQGITNVLFTKEKQGAVYTSLSEKIDPPYPVEEISFENNDAYSLYNWELFFHAPLMIADRLHKNQQFAAAQQWFHYIFDPTEVFPTDRPDQGAWKLGKFFKEGDAQKTIDKLMNELNGGDKNLIDQVNQWRSNPFKPHLLARLRTTPYMKTVVMKYIDNLIDWGDQLFRRDTIESINEATQLYILAATILGSRPQELPEQHLDSKTYDTIKDSLDAFSNATVQLENETQFWFAESFTSFLHPTFNHRFYFYPDLFPSLGSLSASSSSTVSSSEMISSQDTVVSNNTLENSDELQVGNSSHFSLPTALYFCIPQNDQLLSYWDTVADRLFKIRHCMNIEGIVRQLPLFEPPIEPGLLVRAAAAGLDLSSVLKDVNVTLPYYRFNVMVQKATELGNEVKALGAALLSALEKRDAEELSLLRSTHEIQLLETIKEVKKQQIEEAGQTLESLNKSKEITETRRDYYRDIARISYNEQLNMDSLATAYFWNQIAQGIQAAIAAAHTVPNFDVGIAGWASPVVKTSFGGNNLGSALQAAATAINMIAADYSHTATMASIKGGYERRWDDWKLQEKLANKELEQIDKQIIAAEIRVAIAEQELNNHQQQIDNAREIDDYMHDKFTNQELYDWMVGQISKIYFQSYQLAYDVAKRAEKAYQFELGLTNSNFIQFGYWDNLKKGLLAAENLHYDLKRLEMSYFDQNKREYEITKHISLQLYNPLALLVLKETGECEVNLPEALFDTDYPGHYMRRLKSVSLTIPCITGPYTSVSCTLTLQSSRIRKITAMSPDNNGYTWTPGDFNDNRFHYNLGGIQSIATSSAQNDSGLFELNFRDERYLPFEGAGAISTWRIELPKEKEFRQFDYDTISDAILHIRYTAREGGQALKDAATAEVKRLFAEPAAEVPLVQMFSSKQEFPSEWHQFLHPSADATYHTLNLDLVKKRFPFQFREQTIEIKAMYLFLKLKKDFVYDNNLSFVLKNPDGDRPYSFTKEAPDPKFMLNGSLIQDLPYAKPFEDDGSEGLGQWLIEVPGFQIVDNQVIRQDIPQNLKNPANHHLLNPDAIDDLLVVCQYQ